ncbi:MAG: beta-glucosidase [Subtercola sp.]|nr:beta-glucosidase [Subtercola sp.]
MSLAPDLTLSPALRAADLLAQMTLPEKIGQMLQLDARGDLDDVILQKLAGSLLHTSPDRMIAAHDLVQATRLKIPLLMADDAIHGHSFWPGATILPTQLGMAGTWDPELIERGARMAAIEIAATGLHWTFSPVLCIARDLRWGRVNETFGEDGHLIGELGAAMVRGYQGGGLDDPTAVLATAKHFAGYSETQGGRDSSEADLSRRKLRSWFLPPFERVVAEGCRTVMLGYQAIEGVPVTANGWLINDVLKGEWGFSGTLVTDWDNVGRMVWEQRVAADDVEAAAIAVNAGNDIVMNTPAFFGATREAVAGGAVDEATLDDAVRRILTLKFELGLFENPRLPDLALQESVIGSAPHTALNLEVARRSLVLLQNDGTLPLPASSQAAARRTIAILGPNADDPDAQLGDWAGSSGQVEWMADGHPREKTVTVLDGFRASVPEGWEVTTSRGADIGGTVPDPEGEFFPDGQPRPSVFRAAEVDPDVVAAARTLAHQADWAVVVVGDTVALAGEGRSTASLELQGAQNALIDALVDSGTPVVIVLIQSKPSTLPASASRAAAIIEAFNPGMQGGRAIAELVLGVIEPSGRLPISFARHAGQLPVYYNQVRGQHGSRYADLTQQPLFAFGDGLSYTTVEYSELRLDSVQIPLTGTVHGSVVLSNTGSRPSRETVQLYLRDEITSATWADRELKGFTQHLVGPGQSVRVPFELPAAACSLVDASGRRVVEPGWFTLMVGPSSRESTLLTTRFELRASA